MNLFQVFALLVVLGLLILTALATLRGWASRREALLGGTVWVVAGVAVLWPGVTKRAANVLGIGRGADLVLYCTAVVMMIGFVMIYARLRRLRRELTLLVRHLALRDAAVETSPSLLDLPAVPHSVGDSPAGSAPQA